MSDYSWNDRFLALFDKCLALFNRGSRDWRTWYSEEDLAFLKSIGYQPREFFDYVEDFGDGAPLPPSTALLIAAARRDYFLVVQHGKPSTRQTTADELPAKSAEINGIPWLPRIIAKARAKLRGEMHPDLMFSCGGDRAFLTKCDIHPADFLRVVWAAGDDDRKVIDYVKARAKA